MQSNGVSERRIGLHRFDLIAPFPPFYVETPPPFVFLPSAGCGYEERDPDKDFLNGRSFHSSRRTS